MTPWIWLGLFTAAWLVPIAWHGLVERPLPGLPPVLARTTNVSCLFVDAQRYFPVQYIQVLLPGRTEWTTEEDGHYLRMSPFGTRTRFDEMLRKRLDNPRALGELAAFVRARHAARTGVAPSAVRFVTGIVLPDPAPRGRFRKPALSSLPAPLRQVWYTQVYAPVPPEILRKRA